MAPADRFKDCAEFAAALGATSNPRGKADLASGAAPTALPGVSFDDALRTAKEPLRTFLLGPSRRLFSRQALAFVVASFATNLFTALLEGIDSSATATGLELGVGLLALFAPPILVRLSAASGGIAASLILLLVLARGAAKVTNPEALNVLFALAFPCTLVLGLALALVFSRKAWVAATVGYFIGVGLLVAGAVVGVATEILKPTAVHHEGDVSVFGFLLALVLGPLVFGNLFALLAGSARSLLHGPGADDASAALGRDAP